jgi:TonB family protein
MKKTLATLVLATCAVPGVILAETRVASEAALSAAVDKPSPIYPAVAKQMKIVGHVEVEVSINTNGTVSDAKAVSGNPILTRAAIDAVRRWKFTPFVENGVSVPAVAVLKFDFKS